MANKLFGAFQSFLFWIQSCSNPKVVDCDKVEKKSENENRNNKKRVVYNKSVKKQSTGKLTGVPTLNLGAENQQIDGIVTTETSSRTSDTESVEGNSGNFASKCTGNKPQENSTSLLDVHIPLRFNIDLCRDLSPSIGNARLIGRGGFANVYKSFYFGVSVAIKHFHFEHQMPLNNQQKDCFKHELSIISQLDHENIVKFYGVCLKPGSRALVMEYVESNLQKMIENMRNKIKRKFGLKNIFRIIKAIASALEYLHSKNIVHRDLHPQNVLISKDGLVKVADVGISKVLQHSTSCDSKRGGISGYLAPEIFEGSVHCKSDIYSLGIIACELWSLDQSWNDLGEGRLYQKISCGERPYIPHDIPASLLDLITKCWHQDYKSRPTARRVVNICEKELAILASLKDAKK